MKRRRKNINKVHRQGAVTYWDKQARKMRSINKLSDDIGYSTNRYSRRHSAENISREHRKRAYTDRFIDKLLDLEVEAKEQGFERVGDKFRRTE